MLFVALRLFWIILIALIATAETATNIRADDDHANNIQDEHNDDYSFLVVGGYRPKKHFYAKYIVSLREGRGDTYQEIKHYCGGSIIKPKLILTAAHCVVDQHYHPSPAVITVVSGSPYLNKQIPSVRDYSVERTLVHPVFSFSTMRSDVALMFLEKAIDLDDETRAIVPLIDKSPTSGMKCVALGWGRIFPGGPRPVELVYVNLTLMKRSTCFDFYPMNPTVICAADAADIEKGVWKGDSGGPLICDGKLTGIVSFGFPKDDAPSFFANVYDHRKWILENSGMQINLRFSCLVFALISALFTAGNEVYTIN